MPGRLRLIIFGGLGLLVAGVAVFFALRQPPQPAATTPVTSAPTPAAPVPTTTPEASATPRRTPAATKSTEPTPTATPVAPTTATLTINSDVPGATVFIDRKFLGAMPVTVPDVEPGEHRLNATADGHEGIAETITVEPGPRTITLSFKAVKLDAKVDVVHKHGMGSCAGVLSATPDGIRYETTNKDDGFRVLLTDLTTFEVNYLEKNLKVKLKNGKTLNFTTSDGNTDALFVFQRDVDKVRKKLIGG